MLNQNGCIHHTLYAHITELPKSSKGALGGPTSAFNFRACEIISTVHSILVHGNYGKCDAVVDVS